jgi:hypothetical protein
MIVRLMILLMLAAATASAHPGTGIAVSRDGVVYFVDTGAGIFAIQPGGQVRRLDGPAFHFFAFDPDSRFRNTNWPYIPGAEFPSAGPVVMSSDFPVTIGADGKFYYPDGTQGGRVRIVAIDPSGQTSVRATLPPVRRGGQEVTWIDGLAAGADGSLFYTEDRAIRKIDRQGRVSTVVANVVVKDCASVPGTQADLPYLRGLAAAADGSIYVAAAGCAAVLKVNPDGRYGTVLRSSPPWSPTGIAIGGGDVYVLEYLHTASENRREWIPRVRKISAAGTVTTIGSSRSR